MCHKGSDKTITVGIDSYTYQAMKPCRQLSVPRVRRSTFWTRAFSVAGPTVWNSLPDHLRDPAVNSEQFRRDLKTYLFAGHSKR